MGSAGSCEKCTPSGQSSVINLSDRLVGKLLEGNLERTEIVYEEEPPPIIGCVEDQDWIEKLKCIDESHSLAYGLTLRDFNMLCEKLLKKFTERMRENKTLKKGKNILMECLEKNDGCALNCMQEMSDFMELIDLEVYHILTEKQKDDFMQSEINKCKPPKNEDDDDED